VPWVGRGGCRLLSGILDLDLVTLRLQGVCVVLTVTFFVKNFFVQARRLAGITIARFCKVWGSKFCENWWQNGGTGTVCLTVTTRRRTLLCQSSKFSDVRHPRCVSYNGKELRIEYAQSNAYSTRNSLPASFVYQIHGCSPPHPTFLTHVTWPIRLLPPVVVS